MLVQKPSIEIRSLFVHEIEATNKQRNILHAIHAGSRRKCQLQLQLSQWPTKVEPHISMTNLDGMCHRVLHFFEICFFLKKNPSQKQKSMWKTCENMDL